MLALALYVSISNLMLGRQSKILEQNGDWRIRAKLFSNIISHYMYLNFKQKK
jgi:hypothetical protein